MYKRQKLYSELFEPGFKDNSGSLAKSIKLRCRKQRQIQTYCKYDLKFGYGNWCSGWPSRLTECIIFYRDMGIQWNCFLKHLCFLLQTKWLLIRSQAWCGVEFTSFEVRPQDNSNILRLIIGRIHVNTNDYGMQVFRIMRFHLKYIHMHFKNWWFYFYITQL